MQECIPLHRTMHCFCAWLKTGLHIERGRASRGPHFFWIIPWSPCWTHESKHYCSCTQSYMCCFVYEWQEARQAAPNMIKTCGSTQMRTSSASAVWGLAKMKTHHFGHNNKTTQAKLVLPKTVGNVGIIQNTVSPLGTIWSMFPNPETFFFGTCPLGQ